MHKFPIEGSNNEHNSEIGEPPPWEGSLLISVYRKLVVPALSELTASHVPSKCA